MHLHKTASGNFPRCCFFGELRASSGEGTARRWNRPTNRGNAGESPFAGAGQRNPAVNYGEAVVHRSTAPVDTVTLATTYFTKKRTHHRPGRWCVLFNFYACSAKRRWVKPWKSVMTPSLQRFSFWKVSRFLKNGSIAMIIPMFALLAARSPE